MIQKILANKPILIADYREEEIINLIKNVKVIKENLPVGDFIVGNVLLERKTENDFLKSIFDGRIFNQVEEALKNFEKLIIIVESEGFLLNEKEQKIYYGMLARLLSLKNVSIIFTNSKEETALFLEKLCEKFFEKGEIYGIVRVKKNVKIKKQIENILMSFPGISIKTAQKIMKKFENLLDFFNSSEAKLKTVLPEKRAKKIFNLLRTKFEK